MHECETGSVWKVLRPLVFKIKLNPAAAGSDRHAP